jgi:hypothetical protein
MEAKLRDAGLSKLEEFKSKRKARRGSEAAEALAVVTGEPASIV